MPAQRKVSKFEYPVSLLVRLACGRRWPQLLLTDALIAGRAQKLELSLKLAINRASIHKQKKVENSNKTKREIAKLLEQGKDALARVKVGARTRARARPCVFVCCARRAPRSCAVSRRDAILFSLVERLACACAFAFARLCARARVRARALSLLSLVFEPLRFDLCV